MRLPLLIHGKPRTLKSAAKVSLGPGRWKIEHNVVDSLVYIVRYFPLAGPKEGESYIKPEQYHLNGKEMVVAGGCSVQIFVETPGTEDHLSVYAEQL
jgi:hypothetical protein